MALAPLLCLLARRVDSRLFFQVETGRTGIVQRVDAVNLNRVRTKEITGADDFTDLGEVRIHERLAEAQEDSLNVDHERIGSDRFRINLQIERCRRQYAFSSMLPHPELDVPAYPLASH